MKKTTIVTCDLLEKLGACGDQLARFQKLFPKGADLSNDNHIKKARARGLDCAWLLGRADEFLYYPNTYLLLVYPLRYCALAYVEEQTPELCLAAVRQSGWGLEHVREQTPEICLAAVSNTGYALEHVREQTPEICLAAVRQTGLALRYVREQTPELCFAAVRQHGHALKYVKEQTIDICRAATRQRMSSLQYVVPELYDRVLAYFWGEV